MEAEYRRDLQHSYLVLHPDKSVEKNSYPLRMITENNIKGLLPCSSRQIDDEVLYYYDITSKISLAQRCQNKKLGGQELLVIICGLIQALMNMEEYLLADEALNLEAQYIYLDVQMKEITFCFVPGAAWNIEKEFRELMEYLLPYIDHQDQDGVMIGYGVYRYALEQIFSVEGLRYELEKYQRKQEKTITAHNETENRTNTNIEGYQEKNIDKARDVNGIKDRDKLMNNCPDENIRKQKQHEAALDAFFDGEDEEEMKNNTHPAVVTLGTMGILIYILSGWYLWKNYPDNLWLWGGVGILTGVGCVLVYRILSRTQPQRFKQAEKSQKSISPVKNERFREVEEHSREWNYMDNNIEHDDEQAEEEILSTEEPEAECYTQILRPMKNSATYILEEKYPVSGRQVILTGQEVTFLGQLPQAVDLVLPSQTISRMHARIRLEEGKYYISDMNSRNGTWVNGEELQGNQEIELEVDDEVRFADLVYRFRKM
ncbi:MAG: FHA domain-containing protein [Clostridia bacterium]|nr:FHA domain-containing protein [Clostridia bacterium]